MKRISRKCKCGSCGENQQYDEISGLTIYDRELDGNPCNNIFFENLQICPICSYCSWDIQKEPSIIQKRILDSESYKIVMLNSALTNMERKLRLRILLSHGDEKKLAISYLNLVWYLENDKRNSIEEQKYAVYHLEKYLESNVDIELACIYIDCCRKIGNFEESRESIISLKKYVREREEVKKVLNYEEQLCIRRDRKSHKIREIEG